MFCWRPLRVQLWPERIPKNWNEELKLKNSNCRTETYGDEALGDWLNLNQQIRLTWLFGWSGASLSQNWCDQCGVTEKARAASECSQKHTVALLSCSSGLLVSLIQERTTKSHFTDAYQRGDFISGKVTAVTLPADEPARGSWKGKRSCVGKRVLHRGAIARVPERVASLPEKSQAKCERSTSC